MQAFACISPWILSILNSKIFNGFPLQVEYNSLVIKKKDPPRFSPNLSFQSYLPELVFIHITSTNQTLIFMFLPTLFNNHDFFPFLPTNSTPNSCEASLMLVFTKNCFERYWHIIDIQHCVLLKCTVPWLEVVFPLLQTPTTCHLDKSYSTSHFTLYAMILHTCHISWLLLQVKSSWKTDLWSYF